jgi:TRAP-type C4-dicarboxylate transport system substrate-binding protein
MQSELLSASRRQVMALARRYGVKAALFVAAGGGLSGLSQFLASDAAAQRKAAYRLRFGASVINERNDELYHTGIINLAKRIEQATEGEVHVQIIDSGGACAEASCGDKVANGVLDMGSSSTQNLGSVFPYTVALDLPFLWSDRQGFLNLFCAPQANFAFRDVLRQVYRLEPLFMSGDMRDIMLGRKYAEAPEVRSPQGLAGAKMRITNSEPIRQFAAAIGMSPIPLAWTELLEGLKSGVVDAAETWPTAAAGGGMTKVVSQDVAIGFCPGSTMVFMSSSTFERLPDRLKERVWEAGLQAMQEADQAMMDARERQLGIGPAGAGAGLYREHGVRYVALSEAERAAFADLAGIDGRNGGLYDAVRKQVDSIAGFDVYGALKDFAQSVRGKPLTPQRWWA